MPNTCPACNQRMTVVDERTGTHPLVECYRAEIERLKGQLAAIEKAASNTESGYGLEAFRRVDGTFIIRARGLGSGQTFDEAIDAFVADMSELETTDD